MTKSLEVLPPRPKKKQQPKTQRNNKQTSSFLKKLIMLLYISEPLQGHVKTKECHCKSSHCIHNFYLYK